MYFDVPFSSRVFLTCPFFVAISRLGSISAVSRVQSLILPEERWGGGGGWVRAHFPEQQLVIEPNSRPKLYNF